MVDLQWFYVLDQYIFPYHVKNNFLIFKSIVMKYIFTNRVNKTLPKASLSLTFLH